MRREWLGRLTAGILALAMAAGSGCGQEASKSSDSLAGINGENRIDGIEADFYSETAVENWFACECVQEVEIPAADLLLDDRSVNSFPVIAERDSVLSFSVTPPQSGSYVIVPRYRPVGDVLAVDALYAVASGQGEGRMAQLQMLWHDSRRHALDRSGNETTARQEALEEWIRGPFLDYGDLSKDMARWELSEGEKVSFSIAVQEQGIELSGLTLCMLREEESSSGETVGEVPTITIEAEEYALKSDSSIRAAAVRSSALFPYDTYKKRINLLDGSTFKTSGQKVLWEFEVETEGDYRVGMRCRQNGNANKRVYRRIEVDGAVPFAEWKAAVIPYTGSSGYANHTLQAGERDGIIHLTPGRHTIAMTVTAGDYEPVYEEIYQLMTEVNEIGMALLKMTGGVTDANRTWDMEAYMPEAVPTLTEYAARAEEIYQKLLKIDGKEPVYAMDLLTARDKLLAILKEPEKIPGNTQEIFRGDDSASKYLGNVLEALSDHSLTVDRIYVYGQQELPAAEASMFTSLGEGIKRFFWSFLPEASEEGAIAGEDEEELTVWVGQASMIVDLLQQMVDETYNKEHGTNIKLVVMPTEQKLVLSNAAGNNPDVVLCAPSGLPYTFAFRGAMKNLLEYEDFLEFYDSQYQIESLVQTSFGDGVYGAVDSRNFQLLFYRKDIMDSLGLTVPETWEDVEAMMPVLLRNQMNFYLPTSANVSLKGLGVTTPYIYQKGGEIYSTDGMFTEIDSAASLEAITKMTDFYRIYGMQQTVNSFYQSFRYGEIPIGIGDFNMYLQLKMAAPELAGLWDVALVPGTRQEDGSILRYQPANATAAMIFGNTEKSQEAWEFLKWWLSQETQYEFSVRRCATFGQEYQWNTANIQAFSQLPFDSGVKELALEMWQHQREVTPHPAAYMLERELSGVWDDVVISNKALVESVDRAVLTTNREITRKMVEFGYLDDEGNLIKDYNIEILKMLYEELERTGGKKQ